MLATIQTKSVPKGKLKRLLQYLNDLMDKHARISADGKGFVGYQTAAKRRKVLRRCYIELYTNGYKIKRPEQIRTRHIEWLVKRWMAQGLSASTLQTQLSILRFWCYVIGKNGMMNALEPDLFQLEEFKRKASRTYVADTSKNWESSGVDPLKVINQISQTDPRVGVILLLQYAFGLRVAESIKFKPHLADQSTHVDVLWGTKGGRSRVGIAIDTPHKREIMNMAKGMAKTRHSSMIPDDMRYIEFLNHYYYVLRKHGITRKQLKVTSHGLRHGYAQTRYAELTGVEAPVCQSQVPLFPLSNNEQSRSRLVIAAELGHSREQITNVYLGKKAVPTERSTQIDDVS